MNLSRPHLVVTSYAFPVLADSSEAPAQTEVSNFWHSKCEETPWD